MSARSGRSGRGRLGRVVVAVVAMGALGLAACVDGPTETEVVFEVIEEAEFAASLNIDLASMTMLPEGVYIQDVVAGTGPGLAAGGRAWVYYELRLRDATPIDNGLFDFEFPAGNTIQGWNIGLEGMMAGGTRVILIPPGLGYGAAGQPPVPPGAILHFRIELDSIT
jgi:FKBP-type peptidyl-prolyl cis-trans isomerase FkpA